VNARLVLFATLAITSILAIWQVSDTAVAYSEESKKYTEIKNNSYPFKKVRSNSHANDSLV
jgi:cytochrome oxidase assembly protein ShyY1